MVHTKWLHAGGTRLLTLSAIVAAGATAHSQETELQLRWRHGDESNWWVADTVSIGNHGQTAITSYSDPQGGGSTLLFSSYDSHPPAPLAASSTSQTRSDHVTASSELADTHVAFFFVDETSTAKRPTLRMFGSESGSAAWTYSFPFTVSQPRGYGAAVSADGERIAVWVYNSASSRTQLAVFSPESASPTHYSLVDTLSIASNGMMSRDGSTLAFVSDYRTTIYSLTEHTTLAQIGHTGTASNAHSISADGNSVVRSHSDGDVEVHRRNGSGYSLHGTFEAPSPWVVMLAEIAPDGEHVILTLMNPSAGADLRLMVVDVSDEEFAVEMDDPLATNNYQNTPIVISQTLDGRRFALGLAGDSLGHLPEILVFEQGVEGWALLTQQDLPGSVMDLQISANGSQLAVASMDNHIYGWSGHGRVEVFDIDSDLSVRGVPESGSLVEFTQRAQPGRHTFLVTASALAPAPEVLGRVGTLYLLRPSVNSEVMDMGTADEQGVATMSYEVPDDLSFVGTTLYFQGLKASPRQLSTNFVSMTVLP